MTTSAGFSQLAQYGVIVFFVISGFLITSLLLAEQDLTGAVSLRNFYARRALRIVPAYLVFLGSIVVASWIGLTKLTSLDLITAATWTVNFYPHRSWPIAHIWSLSVEEQFYLVWPALLAYCGIAVGRKAAWIAFLSAPIVRAAMHVLLPHSEMRDLEIFPAVADAMAIGCLVAVDRKRLLATRWWPAITRPVFVLIMLVAVALVVPYMGYTAVSLLVSSAVLIALAAMVEGSTRWAGPAASLLNSYPLVWIGTLSYSLYLWQQPFLNRHGVYIANRFPLNLILTVCAATLSYYCIERPFLRMRKRFRRVPMPRQSATNWPNRSV